MRFITLLFLLALASPVIAAGPNNNLSGRSYRCNCLDCKCDKCTCYDDFVPLATSTFGMPETRAPMPGPVDNDLFVSLPTKSDAVYIAPDHFTRTLTKAQAYVPPVSPAAKWNVPRQPVMAQSNCANGQCGPRQKTYSSPTTKPNYFGRRY